MNSNGFAIAIAWPATLCKQAGSWYDRLLINTKFNKNGYYKVGHAAVVLVNPNTKECFYYDFGRYHAPHGKGRVRSAFTDHDLTIKTKAILSENRDQIENLDFILEELLLNASCHGTGDLHASTTQINFLKATQYAQKLQDKDFIPYGPFVFNGTNCSRFVNNIIKTGKPKLQTQIKLNLPPMLTPTPTWNIKALEHKKIIMAFSNLNLESEKLAS